MLTTEACHLLFRFGISLVAVLDTTVEDPHLQLNPGPSHILKATDFCFYMSVTKEEYAKIQPDALKHVDLKSNRAKNMGESFLSTRLPRARHSCHNDSLVYVYTCVHV